MNSKAKTRASGKQDTQQPNRRFGTRGFDLKRLAMVLVCAATMVASNASFCSATETDRLLEKLVEKEVLTESEADEIRKEIDAEAGMRWGDWFTTSVFGQYVASDADSENGGYLAGLQFGHQKVGKLWDWQVKYNYRHQERDAFPDFLPDSDFYDGSTDAEGHEVEPKLGVARNVSLGADCYFNVAPIEATDTGGSENRLQLDVVIKY